MSSPQGTSQSAPRALYRDAEPPATDSAPNHLATRSDRGKRRRGVHPSRIPVSCPLPREQLIKYLAEPDALGALNPNERACDGCAYARRLTVLSTGRRVRFTACHAPERAVPGLVYAHEAQPPERAEVDARVLAAIEAGVRDAPTIGRGAGISQRAAWKSAARLRAAGTLPAGLRLHRDPPEPSRPGRYGPDPRITARAILAALADGMTDPDAIAERVGCHLETVRRHLERLRRS